VLLKFPDLKEDSEDRRRFDEIVEKISSLPGIRASFHHYGSRTLDKASLLERLDRPDSSGEFTHCLFMVADDLRSLRDYLHGSVQTKELSPTIGRFFRGVVVVDCELGTDLSCKGKTDPVLQVALLRFLPHVTKESAAYKSFLELVAQFEQHSGIRAALRPLGHGELGCEELLNEIQWHDRTDGVTHCLTIAADSVDDLHALLSADVYDNWQRNEALHLCDDGEQPGSLIFHIPQRLEVTAH